MITTFYSYPSSIKRLSVFIFKKCGIRVVTITIICEEEHLSYPMVPYKVPTVHRPIYQNMGLSESRALPVLKTQVQVFNIESITFTYYIG